jgi:hypothetical protein
LGEGIFARLPKKRSPAAPPENLEDETEQKNFLFLLEEKNRRAQNQKMRRKFFCEVAAGALAEAGGGAERSKFAVRIFVKKSSDFVQKVPQIGKMQIGRGQLAARDAPLVKNLKELFGEKEKDLSRKGKRNFFIRIFSNSRRVINTSWNKLY